MERVFQVQTNVLRVCRVCGLEAQSIDDLSMFKTDTSKKYGVSNICKDCGSLYDWKRRNPTLDTTEYLYNKQAKKDIKSKGIIKKCIHCGFEIFKITDLKFFTKDKNAALGHTNICKKCKNIYGKKFKEQPDIKSKYKEVAKKRANTKEAKSKKCINQNKRRVRLNVSWYFLYKQELVNKIYLQAQYLTEITGTKYVVDHIYPLKHPLMCGLNIIYNLQILDFSTNSSKNNNLGYLYQFNCTPLAVKISPKASREEVFNTLGSSITYTEFLEYEYKNFKGYTDEQDSI